MLRRHPSPVAVDERIQLPRLSTLFALLAALAVACGDPPSSPLPNADEIALDRGTATNSADSDSDSEDDDDSRFRVRYGKRVRVGDGYARTYVVVAKRDRIRPVEIGIALSQRALHGLPSGHEHVEYLLPLPRRHGTPYRLVELDWNPMGHEPPNIYGAQHFDFHFYTISLEERNAIVPTNPHYAAQGNNLPPGEFVPPHYIVPVPPGVDPVAAAVPRMGIHWIDPRSPEFNGNPFTRTFIYGSWNGRITFGEPMVTRDYLLSKSARRPTTARNEVIGIPVAARHMPAGFYPSAYRVAFDPKRRQYRVALTRLAWRN